MSEAVLDSSVIIAIIKKEQFEESVLDVLEGAVMSTVNFAEVWTKLHDFGLTEAPRVAQIFSLLSRIEPFTETQSRLAADLRPATRQVGLSLGDRACLALAIETGSEVYTAEHLWTKLNLPCKVHLIRQAS